MQKIIIFKNYNQLQKGEQIKELSATYGIPIKNLQRWKIYGAERREGGGRKIMDLNMEVILLEYCIDFTLRSRCRCPRKIIMQKAKDFTKESNRFKASKGWLDKYSSRTGLSKIMSEYKQLKVANELDIFKLVKLKSLQHIKSKIKTANPLRIFTCEQYIRFLEEGLSNHNNFWNLKLDLYKVVAKEFEQYLTVDNNEKVELNIFQQILNNQNDNKDLQISKKVSELFGMTTNQLLENIKQKSCQENQQHSQQEAVQVLNSTKVNQEHSLNEQYTQLNILNKQHSNNGIDINKKNTNSNFDLNQLQTNEQTICSQKLFNNIKIDEEPLLEERSNLQIKNQIQYLKCQQLAQKKQALVKKRKIPQLKHEISSFDIEPQDEKQNNVEKQDDSQPNLNNVDYRALSDIFKYNNIFRS